MWMNEVEIEHAAMVFDPMDTPNLAQAAHTLDLFVDWVSTNSDGWAYWLPAHRAANRLMTLIEPHIYAARYGYYQRTHAPLQDVTRADVTKALTPIKSLLTRHGVDHRAVLS